jgi:hypothetical protein
MWHDNIARGDHECVEGVMESDCALADSNEFNAESNMHCDTDTYISDSNMHIADCSIVVCTLLIVTCCADSKCAL